MIQSIKHNSKSNLIPKLLNIMLFVLISIMFFCVHNMHATDLNIELCYNNIDDDNDGVTDEIDCVPGEISPVQRIDLIYSRCTSDVPRSCSSYPEYCEYFSECDYVSNGRCAWPGENVAGTGDCETDCTDGIDNEIDPDTGDTVGDGLVDCNDPDCTYSNCKWCRSYTVPSLGYPSHCVSPIFTGTRIIFCNDDVGQKSDTEHGYCNDGFDNDGDAFSYVYVDNDCKLSYDAGAPIDCEDNNCYTDAVCCGDNVCRPREVCAEDCVGTDNAPQEVWCRDGVDNDEDGLIDCNDDDCTEYFLCKGIKFECATGDCSVEMIEHIEEGELFPMHGAINSLLVNWQLTSVILMLISVIIIALLYAAGTSMQNQQLTAMARNELGQVFVSVIFLMIIIGALYLLESVSAYIMQTVYVEYVPAEGESVHFVIAHRYIADTRDVAKLKVMEVLKQTNVLGKKMTLREGWSWQDYPFISLSKVKEAGNRMKFQRNNDVITAYSNIISTLTVQESFLKGFAWVFGPLMIILGIMFRSFSFTRRIGGLFLAIGIGLFFVFPLTYALALYTMSSTVYGGSHALPPPTDCPAECVTEYPVAYDDTGPYYVDDLIKITPPGHFWNDEDAKIVMQANNPELKFCDDMIDDGGCCADNDCSIETSCPHECRVRPLTNEQCVCNFTACSICNDSCKITRLMPACTDRSTLFRADFCPSTLCPDQCKKDISDAITEDHYFCKDCPWMCRWQDKNGWVMESDIVCDEYSNNDNTGVCDNCDAKYVMPDMDVLGMDCDTLCECPHYARVVDGNNPLNNIIGEYNPSDFECNDNCEDICKYNMNFDEWHHACKQECTYTNDDGIETICPDECRFADEFAAPECFENNDLLKACDACPNDCKVMTLKRRPCSACVLCDEDCTRMPAVRTKCSGECLSYSGEFTLNPSKMLSKMDNLAAEGDPDLQGVGILMIPAYILPLFNIILTLAFIRGFSKYLGGDYEIPGIEKII
jgi:hypothetical protein